MLLIFFLSFIFSELKSYSVIRNLEIINKNFILTKNILVSDSHKELELKNETPIKLIRTFIIDNEIYYLIINRSTLDAYIVRENIVLHNSKEDKNKNTKLDLMLQKYKEKPLKFRESNNTKNDKMQFFLTIDMCPSSKNYYDDDILYDWLKNISKEDKIKIPLGISITKSWAEKHKKGFDKIRNTKEFNISWINHSSTHPLSSKEGIKNYLFMTDKNVNFEKEILDLEEFLLNKGEIPSIFFRFPGLIYNQELLCKLNKMSLIALDSDTWINKEEHLKNNSIVLIHGNGNERDGIYKFKKEYSILKKNKQIDKLSFFNIKDL